MGGSAAVRSDRLPPLHVEPLEMKNIYKYIKLYVYMAKSQMNACTVKEFIVERLRGPPSLTDSYGIVMSCAVHVLHS